MSLLNQILPKKDNKNHFLVLGLEEHHVRAAVAEVSGDKASILGVGKSEFENLESEMEAVDIAVSMAEKPISDAPPVENVIFALPQFYLEGTNVKPEYKARLKKIAQELSLKAYGFVEYASAVTNYLETTEGSAPTVILMDFSKNHMTVTLVRIGKIQQSVTVERTESIVDDFASTLPQFAAEILPSRIVIFDFEEDRTDVKEDLLKFPWHKHSIFLHTPKIEILKNDIIMKAIVEAAATSFLPNVVPPDQEIQKEEKAETPPPREKFITEEVKEENKEKKQSRFGFTNETLSEKAKIIKEETQSRVKNIIPAGALKEKLSNIKFSIPKLSIKFPSGKILLIVPVLLAIAAIFIAVGVYPEASVSIYTYPLKTESSAEIVFVKEGNSSDSAGNSIQTRTIATEAEGTKTAKTTGSNQIGEKAKGEVTIFNKTLSTKSLPKGTVISSGPIKFTLDSETKVASASETGEGITFGRSSVKVTAAALGPESNLPASSNFLIQDYSDSTLTTKNSQPLSGGTARDIDAISKEDMDKLEEALTNDLISQAKQSLSKELALRGRLLDEPITTTTSSKKFSGEAGSEAKELTLTMKLKIEGLEYNQEDLDKLSIDANGQAPSGFRLDPDKKSVRVTETELLKNGNVEAKVILSNYFVPEFDLTKIKNEIKGKPYIEVQEILEKTENVAGMKIAEVRKMPFFTKRLPQRASNIKLLVVSK